MRLEQLQREHIEALVMQGVTEAKPILENERTLLSLIEDGPGFAGIVDAGVVAIMGMAEYSKDVHRCWALTDPILTRKHFIAVCKGMRGFLAEHRMPRVETLVLKGNVPGHRWITEVLGFQMEGILRNYCAPQDAVIYSRINRDASNGGDGRSNARNGLSGHRNHDERTAAAQYREIQRDSATAGSKSGERCGRE